MNKLSILLLALFLPVTAIDGQDRIHYTGKELSNPAAHDGQLSPVVGVHNLQVMRANREHPDVSNGNGWTYNHQPMTGGSICTIFPILPMNMYLLHKPF